MRARLALAVLTLASIAVASSTFAEDAALDGKVRAFLEKNRGRWRDMNVPWVDGQILHDLVVKNRFRRALEIGTSTGHSSVWIAWALSKTGGKLVTIEIDPARHEEAVRNFQEAGVAPLVDARLADAHQLVKELPGPFDFVFSDADKGWYLQYFKDLEPKLEKGGLLHRPQRAAQRGRRRLGVPRVREEAPRLPHDGRDRKRRGDLRQLQDRELTRRQSPRRIVALTSKTLVAGEAKRSSRSRPRSDRPGARVFSRAWVQTA